MSEDADKNVIFKLAGILSDMPTDEEIQQTHEQQIRAAMLEEVYKRLRTTRFANDATLGYIVSWSDIDCLFAELKGDVNV